MSDAFAGYDQWLLRGHGAGFDDPNDEDDEEVRDFFAEDDEREPGWGDA